MLTVIAMSSALALRWLRIVLRRIKAMRIRLLPIDEVSFLLSESNHDQTLRLSAIGKLL